MLIEYNNQVASELYRIFYGPRLKLCRCFCMYPRELYPKFQVPSIGATYLLRENMISVQYLLKYAFSAKKML